MHSLITVDFKVSSRKSESKKRTVNIVVSSLL